MARGGNGNWSGPFGSSGTAITSSGWSDDLAFGGEAVAPGGPPGLDDDGPGYGIGGPDWFPLDDGFASAKPDKTYNNGNGGGNGGGKGGPHADPGGGEVLTTYTSSAAGSEYNVTVNFVGDWVASLQDEFVAAANYLSSVIVGDLPDIDGVDDIEITAELTYIDGTGGVLGSAGPTHYRSSAENYLPYRGSMQFDSADASNYESDGRWYDIVLHEMFHTLGFGVIWRVLGLVDSSESMFLGTEANRAFQQEYPALASVYDYIPVETNGGPGTAGAHWDDATFGSELMTGYISATNYVSDMTIASLEDLGYDTVWVGVDETAFV